MHPFEPIPDFVRGFFSRLVYNFQKLYIKTECVCVLSITPPPPGGDVK